MYEAKNTARARVRIGYDGLVHKQYFAGLARARFENEVRVLLHLEDKGCHFVPRLVNACAQTLAITTTNCGKIVQHLNEEKMNELYTELESYGVRHEDPFLRNITYRQSDGRFCVIDFEFATILDSGIGLTP